MVYHGHLTMFQVVLLAHLVLPHLVHINVQVMLILQMLQDQLLDVPNVVTITP